MTQTYFRKVSVKEKLPEKQKSLGGQQVNKVERGVVKFVLLDSSKGFGDIGVLYFEYTSKKWFEQLRNIDVTDAVNHWLEELPIKESMTIQEAKDEVARRRGYNNYEDLFLDQPILSSEWDTIVNEVSELYHLSNQPKDLVLPDDEEIINNALDYAKDYNFDKALERKIKNVFIDACKWIKNECDKIKQQLK